MKIQYRPRAADGALASRTPYVRLVAAVDKARRSTKVVRKASRGQTLIIFALTFTILIGFLGLAIDAIRLYDMYARMQRAAEAGALAGVIYMPNAYTTNLTSAPGDNAVCRAYNEVYKNSFGQACPDATKTPSPACPTPVSSTEIAVCQVTDPNNNNTVKPYDLQVTVTETINVLFISALNIGPLRISATAIAEYLPPVQIASDPGTSGGTGSWGTFGECGNSGTGASAACTGTGVRNFAGNINGPGELKEQGDPLVTCEEGSSTGTQDPSANVPSLPYTTYTGLPTNHPQYAQYDTPGAQPVNCGNTDTNNVFTGPAYIASDGTKPLRPGYAFYANMENATAPTNLWIWNLPFNPAQPPSCNGRQSTGQTSYDIFYEYNCNGASGSPYPFYPATGATGPGSPQVCNGQDPYKCTNDPNLLFSVTYSVYDINLANPTAGNLVGVIQAFPLVKSTQCPSGSYLQEASTGLGVAQACVSALCVSQWCPLATSERGGDNNTNPWTNLVLYPTHDYRVMVVTSDYGTPTDTHMGWGGHSFSLKLCPTSATQSTVQTCTTPTGASISGWNMSDVLFTFPGNGVSLAQTTEYPLGVIQSNYSGRTIDVSLYDPGDLLGSKKGVSIYGAVPNLPGVSDPCSETAAQLQAAGYDPAINGANFVFPNSERTTYFNGNIPALEPTMNDDLIYNGLWKDEQITMPPTYTTTAWTLCAQAPLLNDSDVLAIKVLALGQSPVHLVQ